MLLHSINIPSSFSKNFRAAEPKAGLSIAMVMSFSPESLQSRSEYSNILSIPQLRGKSVLRSYEPPKFLLCKRGICCCTERAYLDPLRAHPRTGTSDTVIAFNMETGQCSRVAQ